MLRPNTLKARLRAGARPTGCWIFLAGGDATELLSLCGFDAFVIDHEHIGADLRTLIEQLRATQASEVSCIVRVPSHDPVYIKRVLDVGVDGILVPTVETAEQARAIVAATRYRPHGGHRGVGYPESRAAHWGLAELDYPKRYRDELLVAALVETRWGFENIDEIAAVDGIDAVFLGPGDLAADLASSFDALEAFGSETDDDLARLMDNARRAVSERSDCWLFGISRGAERGRELFEQGYDFVTPAADAWLLADGAKAIVAAMRA